MCTRYVYNDLIFARTTFVSMLECFFLVVLLMLFFFFFFWFISSSKCGRSYSLSANFNSFYESTHMVSSSIFLYAPLCSAFSFASFFLLFITINIIFVFRLCRKDQQMNLARLPTTIDFSLRPPWSFLSPHSVATVSHTHTHTHNHSVNIINCFRLICNPRPKYNPCRRNIM